MDRFKPLIEYYKNTSNLFVDILSLIIMLGGGYYLSDNIRKQFNIFTDVPSIIIAFLIGRSYKLNIISFNEFIIYFMIYYYQYYYL